MTLWQATGFVKGLICLICLIRTVPGFGTLGRRRPAGEWNIHREVPEGLAVNISHRGPHGLLHLMIAIDHHMRHQSDASE